MNIKDFESMKRRVIVLEKVLGIRSLEELEELEEPEKIELKVGDYYLITKSHTHNERLEEGIVLQVCSYEEFDGTCNFEGGWNGMVKGEKVFLNGSEKALKKLEGDDLCKHLLKGGAVMCNVSQNNIKSTLGFDLIVSYVEGKGFLNANGSGTWKHARPVNDRGELK